ncbi:Tryptophan synthase alpha chain [Labilithrix luteola]|uniref:Tryptophan synthase alpha chain n=1 Tax=Labilithrix luteola TaxID=1391654 RepID=A0A0K1QBQ9_9BACT|nr:hypothetical protein [Labilithrix luteola]AKV02850.1 Tryptophan synthase alpha chain [Labilithrix luteola]
MNRSQLLCFGSLWAAGAFLFGIGCNAILDNNEGVLVVTDASGTEPPGTGEPAPVDEDSGGQTGPLACSADQHICVDVCVSPDDPAYGCGADTCDACPTPHATAICQNGACAVGACEAGHADCNQRPDDGCETDLSKPESCGACGTVCPASTPMCAAVDGQPGTFHCATGCSAGAPFRCGTTCIDPNANVDNCGVCNKKCPEVANGTRSCKMGVCAFTCNAPFHACGAACAAENDPSACGAACTVCATPPNGKPTCTGGACGVECTPGFGNCDANALNGCEADFATDALNCGGCGKLCVGTCVGGVCEKPVADAGMPDGRVAR